MSTFTVERFVFLSICFFATQQVIIAEGNGCTTPKLGPKDTLLITIFENGSPIDPDLIWDKLCKAVKQFPEGRVKIEYRPGALATGTAASIKCGSGDCKYDQINACEALHSKFYTDCFNDEIDNIVGSYKCYCNKEINGVLLENSGFRASWNIPETAIPTMAVNQAYDPSIKFGSAEEIKQYLCAVFQNQIGPC